jgi:hypothetical protein
MTSLRTSVPAVAASALAALGLAACAMTPSGAPVPVTAVPAGETQPKDFTATGSVNLYGAGSGQSADFSDFRVVGPRVNMSRNADGTWAGNLDGRDMILTVTPGRIDGYGVNLYVFKKAATVSVQGMFGQRQVWFTMKPDEIQGTTDGGRCSFDLTRNAQGLFEGGVGCVGQVTTATLKLSGAAADVSNPVVPQLVLALLTVFPI